jgi:hypothetical protein
VVHSACEAAYRKARFCDFVNSGDQRWQRKGCSYVNVDSAISAVAEVETSEQSASYCLAPPLKAEMGLNFATNFIAPLGCLLSWLFFFRKEFNLCLAIVTDFQTVVSDVG